MKNQGQKLDDFIVLPRLLRAFICDLDAFRLNFTRVNSIMGNPSFFNLSRALILGTMTSLYSFTSNCLTIFYIIEPANETIQ